MPTTGKASKSATQVSPSCLCQQQEQLQGQENPWDSCRDLAGGQELPRRGRHQGRGVLSWRRWEWQRLSRRNLGAVAPVSTTLEQPAPELWGHNQEKFLEKPWSCGSCLSHSGAASTRIVGSQSGEIPGETLELWPISQPLSRIRSLMWRVVDARGWKLGKISG